MDKAFYILVFLVIVSCSANDHKNSKLPSKTFINGYEIKSEQILYQFFEKFGFTDICIHSRSYFKINKFSATDDWKPLPMNAEDVRKANSIPNKIDSLNASDFSIIYQNKDFFSDINLELEEFVKDTIFDLKIDLSMGYYRIGKDKIEIYNHENSTIYLEYHSCDN